MTFTITVPERIANHLALYSQAEHKDFATR